MKILTRQEEQVLLAVFSLDETAYLVTIREQIKKYTGKYYSVGTIYAPLNRLKVNGYLDETLGEPNSNRGGKAIKYYRLTKDGFIALETLRTQHDMMWDGYQNNYKTS